MTYAKPEQPVLRTPSRSPVPCPRAARKLLTRSAADSVSEMLMDPRILMHPAASTPVREAGAQRIFDHQQPTKFLGWDAQCLRPSARCPWNQLLARPSRQ